MAGVTMKDTEKVMKLDSDVILDIFSRLPSKTLSRFRCVSKQFLNYISTPCLGQLHYQCRSQYPFTLSMALLDVGKNYPIDDYNEVKASLLLSTLDDKGKPISEFTQEIEIDWMKNVFFVPSHHVLVSVITRNHIYVCNPSKKEFVELPKGSDFMSFSHTVGFGYVPSKDVYKVVRCFFRVFDPNEINNCELGCEILTISNGHDTTRYCNLMDSVSASTWRVLEQGCPHFMEVEAPAALVNGSLHWKIDGAWMKLKQGNSILSFNLEEEKFWMLPTPPCAKTGNYNSFHLVELRKTLWGSCLGSESVMDMWVLKDYDSFNWVKEYSIDLSEIPMSMYHDDTSVMNINQDEELLLRNRANWYWVTQFYYNTKTQRIGKPVGEDSRFCFCYYTDVLF